MIRYLLKFKFIALLIIAVLVIWFSSEIPSIKINTDFSQFLPDNDPEYTFYKELKNEIKSDETLLMIALEHNPSVFENDFLKDTKVFLDSLRGVEGIRRVSSLHQMSYPIKSPFGIISFPYLRVNDSTDASAYRSKIKEDYYITQSYINNEETALFVWVELEKYEDAKQYESTLIAIDEIRNNVLDDKTYMWGKQYLQKQLNEITKNNAKQIIIWVLVIIVLLLLFIFRSLWSALSSLLVVIISLILFFGGMAVFDRSFNIMSNLFPTIILVVGISDLIHLAIKYNSAIKDGNTQKNALSLSIKEIGLAIFITSFTTAIGFLILQISPMKVLRGFGLEAGIAVILTFIITIVLAPILFSPSGNLRRFELREVFNDSSKQLLVFFKKLQNYPNKIIWFYSILTVIGIVGIFSINTNNLQYSIPENDLLKTNYYFFEKNFGGSRTFEIVFLSNENHTLNEPELLVQLNQVQTYLENQPVLNNVKSPMLFYRTINQAYNPSQKDNTVLDLDKPAIRKYESQFKNINSRKYLMNADKTIFKFTAQMEDRGRHEVEDISQEILREVNALVDTEKLTPCSMVFYWQLFWYRLHWVWSSKTLHLRFWPYC